MQQDIQAQVVLVVAEPVVSQTVIQLPVHQIQVVVVVVQVTLHPELVQVVQESY
jgi:hypothetical protein